jgi:hypothetical protein
MKERSVPRIVSFYFYSEKRNDDTGLKIDRILILVHSAGGVGCSCVDFADCNKSRRPSGEGEEDFAWFSGTGSSLLL